jgi:RNA polymerase sigma-70 factor (ECF subfamily)
MAMRSRDHLRIAAEPSEAASAEEESGAKVIGLALVRARQGDPRAWARLYQDHFDALHRHATYLVGDPAVAEDVVQEVFARAVVGIAGYDERSSFLAWLRGIASNVVRMHWRSQSRRRTAYDRLEQTLAESQGEKAPDEAHLQAKRAEALLAALETLPANLREAYVLIDLQQRSPDEVATELGVSVGNLRVRASRARARIREELAREGWFSGEEQGA